MRVNSPRRVGGTTGAEANARDRSSGAAPCVVEVERYRTRPIEVDDTACLRTIRGA